MYRAHRLTTKVMLFLSEVTALANAVAHRREVYSLID